MELKDVILSTLAEMEDATQEDERDEDKTQKREQNRTQLEAKSDSFNNISEAMKSSLVDSEALYLNSIRERLLVLFEGFQAPNNTNIEAKVDMTLNFLEYVLATIDSRIEVLEKGKKE